MYKYVIYIACRLCIARYYSVWFLYTSGVPYLRVCNYQYAPLDGIGHFLHHRFIKQIRVHNDIHCCVMIFTTAAMIIIGKLTCEVENAQCCPTVHIDGCIHLDNNS